MTRTISSIVVLTILARSSFAFADCAPSVNLNIGDKVTDCARVGLSLDAAKKTQYQLIEHDYLQKELVETNNLIASKDLMIQNQTQQADLFKADSAREREAYDKERERSKMSFWVGLGVGALSILAGAWAIKQVGK